ncbi:MAG: hypothetical protein LUC90_04785 [Lachnospiraceae bacterium]|nr:hypothetical protein [Lachnospiraceae bacterium]
MQSYSGLSGLGYSSYGSYGSPALDQALVIKDKGTGRIIIDGGSEPAIYFSYDTTKDELPDIVQYVMEEKGYTLGSYDEEYEYSNKVLYDSKGNLVTYLDLHYHHYSYSLSEDGATVSGKCIYCDETDYVTISAPTNLAYDGVSSHDAVLTANKADTDGLSIYYTLDGEAVSSTTAMGEYTASVDYQGLTASVTYSVGKGQITITPSDLTKVYGGDDPALTGEITGLTGTDSIEVTYSREAGETPGTYTISAAYTLDSSLTEKYDVVVNTGTFTIEKAALTVTANDTEITYGDAPESGGVTYSGFVNGDSASDLSGSLSYAYSYVQYGDIGEYTITPSGLSSENYDITYVSGKLTVAAREAVLSWSEPEETDLVYDGTAKTLTASVTNAVNGDTVSVAVALTDGCDNINVTDDGFSYTAVSLDNENYVLPEEAESPVYQITPAAMTITADDASKTYGEADPALSGTVTGVVSGDDLEVTYSRESGEDAGSYEITASYTENANYSVTIEKAVFTICQKAITVTADDQTSVYGDAASELTYSLSAAEKAKLVGEDDLEVSLIVADISSEGASWPSAGSYEITGTSASANYDVTIISGTYTVTRAELIITANDTEITYGDSPEAGGVTYSGFVNLEDESSLTGTLQFDIDYSQYGDAGEYSITPYGLSSDNYSIIYVSGILTVNPRTAVLSWAAPDLEYDSTAKVLTASVSNAVNGDVVEVTVVLDEGCDNINVTNDGFSYTAVALSDSNYVLPADSGSGAYDVMPRELTEADFEALEDVDYTGTQITPAIVISSTSLVTANDYTAAYGENIAVGEGSVTLTGQNNFYGTVTLTFRILDRVAPSGAIGIDVYEWKSFLRNTTFDLFFNLKQTVTVIAYDGESGVAKTEYYLAGEEVTDLSVFSTVTWTEYMGSFEIFPENRYVIYVKITDNAGNYTIINTDGVVLDSILPVIEGLTDGKTYCAEVTFTVTDENYDYTLVNGEIITGTEYTLPAANTIYQVQAFDKAGNESAVYTVTVNDGHVYEYMVNTGDGWAAITRECIHCGVNDTVTLSAPENGVYDGTEHDAALSSDTIDVSGITVSYEKNGAAAESTVEAGEYTASFPYGTKTAAVTYTVSQAQVTITADAASKTYGETDPAFTGTVTGVISGDDLEVVYSRESGEDAGNYQISASYTESANYSVTIEEAVFTIRPKAITVTADDQTSVYGDPVSELTFSFSDEEKAKLVGDDELEVSLSVAAASSEGASCPSPGSKESTVPSASLNYDGTVIPGTYTGTRAELTITANDTEITYGDGPEAGGVTYSGFVYDEDESVLSGTISYETDYTQYGDVGTYTITPAGLTADNYVIICASGTLTVNPLTAELSWTVDDLQYDGTAKTAAASVANAAADGNNIEVTVVLADGCDNVNVTEEGFYYIAVSINNSNYVLPGDPASPVYYITPKELTKPDFDVSEEDREYTGTAITPEVSPTEGRDLVENRDYTVAYGSNTAVGTGTITITGKGNYFGTLEYEFQIVQADEEDTPDSEDTSDTDKTSDPEDTSDEEETPETEEPETQPDTTGTTDTGDASTPGLYFGFMAAALGILLAGSKRKKRDLF